MERIRASRLALVSWALYDWANSAFPTVILTFIFAAYFTRRVAPSGESASAMWGYALGAAGLVIALTAPLLGAAADRLGRNKLWIAAFTLLSSAATALLWFVRPSPDYAPLALFLVAAGMVASELAAVFYNAMLPRLVSAERVGRWSGWAWGLGYAGGLACLAASLALLEIGKGWGDGSAAEVRAIPVLVACWYLVFSLPLFLFAPDPAGPSASLRAALREGGTQLRDSFRRAREHAAIFRFLVAHMIYIDALGTLFALGGVYVSGTFGMGEREVLLFGIVLNVAASLGAVAFAWVDDAIGSKATILLALLGLASAGSGLLVVEGERPFWALAVLLGIFVGPLQAASRSNLVRLAPPSLVNEMFGLYAFSGKATSFLGPLAVAVATSWSGSQRVGMTPVIVLFALGFAAMLTVPASGGPPKRETRSCAR